MATLTIRLTDQKAERLKALAAHQNTSVNKLMDELATYALAEFDAETRFHLRAARGSAARGKAFLAELDDYYSGGGGDNEPPPSSSVSSGRESYSFHDQKQSDFDHGAPVKGDDEER